MKVLFRAVIAAGLLLAPVAAHAHAIVARVSVGTQTMHVYLDGQLRYEWPVSTAGNGYITPRGEWEPTWLSRWHRIDATETWSFEDGAPMGLRISGDGVSVAHHLVEEGAPVTVPAHAWQSAVSMGAWSLVRCAVRPGFSFDGFEMAPPSWSPPGG